MSKRSKQLAAKYAEKSRTKKSEKRPNVPILSRTVMPDDHGAFSDAGYSPSEEEVASSLYGYVSQDLKRMGITIGILAIILVIITVFLR